jgi:hypothetical protein
MWYCQTLKLVPESVLAICHLQFRLKLLGSVIISVAMEICRIACVRLFVLSFFSLEFLF